MEVSRNKVFEINHYCRNITGYNYSVKEFPLKVELIAAPKNPMGIVIANYLTCIEGEMHYPIRINEWNINRVHKEFEWILKGGHSPSLECIHLTFGIQNASIVLLKQISRHRIGNSLGVMTQRANAEEWLGKMFDNNHYVIPPSIAKNKKALKLYKDCISFSQDVYNALIENGIQQDEARYCIPQGVTTMWHGTYSYKTLLDGICSTRLCELMQGEMVALAMCMKSAVTDYNRIMGDALKPICFRTGQCNRNENNPTASFPKGVCKYTIGGEIPMREPDNTHDLTQYSRSANE